MRKSLFLLVAASAFLVVSSLAQTTKPQTSSQSVDSNQQHAKKASVGKPNAVIVAYLKGYPSEDCAVPVIRAVDWSGGHVKVADCNRPKDWDLVQSYVTGDPVALKKKLEQRVIIIPVQHDQTGSRLVDGLAPEAYGPFYTAPAVKTVIARRKVSVVVYFSSKANSRYQRVLDAAMDALALAEKPISAGGLGIVRGGTRDVEKNWDDFVRHLEGGETEAKALHSSLTDLGWPIAIIVDPDDAKSNWGPIPLPPAMNAFNHLKFALEEHDRLVPESVVLAQADERQRKD